MCQIMKIGHIIVLYDLSDTRLTVPARRTSPSSNEYLNLVSLCSKWYGRNHYLVLFVLQVAHKASTRAPQRCRSRPPHVQPFSFISLSTVLLQVSLGRPLFLWPSGVHRRAILVKAVVCWRSTCPIHRQRLRLTWVEMGSISALRCSSSLVMVFGQ